MAPTFLHPIRITLLGFICSKAPPRVGQGVVGLALQFICYFRLIPLPSFSITDHRFLINILLGFRVSFYRPTLGLITSHIDRMETGALRGNTSPQSHTAESGFKVRFSQLLIDGSLQNPTPVTGTNLAVFSQSCLLTSALACRHHQESLHCPPGYIYLFFNQESSGSSEAPRESQSSGPTVPTLSLATSSNLSCLS